MLIFVYGKNVVFVLNIFNTVKTKAQKREDINKIKEKASHAKMIVFTAYAKEGERGLSVDQLGILKKSLRGVDVKYVVAKKTLIDKAFQENKIEGVNVFGFGGSLGLAFAQGDEIATAKALNSFTRLNPAMKLLGGLLGTRFLDAAKVVELAKIPSREVLLGRAVGMIQYPLSGLVNVLQGNIRNLVLTLKAVESRK